MGVRARETPVALLLRYSKLTHERIMKLVEDLSDDQVRASVAPSIHSAGWQLWHIARWDDVLAAALVEKTPGVQERLGARRQVWEEADLGRRWGLPVGKMGRRDTGTDMEDLAADQLALPAKPQIVDYAGRAFALFDDVIAALDQHDLFAILPDDPDGDTYADNIVIWMDHASRHLGMMETIKGLLGRKGSATR